MTKIIEDQEQKEATVEIMEEAIMTILTEKGAMHREDLMKELKVHLKSQGYKIE